MGKKIFLALLVTAILFSMFLFFKGNFLDAASPSEQTIPLDPSLFPNKVVIDSLHHYAYIASHTTVDNIAMPVTVLDTLHDTVTGVIPASTIQALAINETTHKIYIGDANLDNISVFDTDTNSPVSTISSLPSVPLELSVNETTNRIYVATNNITEATKSGTVTVIDGNTENILASNITVGSNPKSIYINPLTNRIYVVSADNDPGLAVIDGVTNTEIASLQITQNITDIAIDNVLNKIFITTQAGNSIYVIDGNSNSVSAQIPLAGNINCGNNEVVNQVEHKLYVSCFNGLTVIDTKTNSVIQQMPLTGELPITRAVTSSYFGIDEILNKLYLPLEETHQLAVVSLSDPPKIDPGVPITANEGDNVTIPFSFTDKNSSSWKISADFGDGTPIQTSYFASTSGSFNHVFKENKENTVTITVTNSVGAAGSITIPVKIQNISPTVGLITASNTSISVNTNIIFNSSFTDPGIWDTHTAIWDFGDGVKSQGLISGTGASGNITGSHVYSLPGVYTVLLTVTDKDNAETTNNLQYIAVNDGIIQSASGEGLIDFPKGDLKANMDFAGRMNIGFSVKNKYENADATGSAQFNLQSGNLDFRSDTITSLLTNGNSARVTGVGKINNAGNLAFLLYVNDNSLLKSPNTVRLKIWDISTGNVVYDTQMGEADSTDPRTILSNGSLLIN